jgi:hypothetical protein
MASKSKKRRKRRRARASGEPPAQAEAAGREVPSPRRRRAAEEPPEAPWGSFPLVELAVLVGIVMLVLGLFFVDGRRGGLLIGTGLLLGSIGGLELSIREHLAGYRSHTLILAGVPAVAVLALLFYAGPDSLPPLGRAAIGLIVFVGAAWALVAIFRDRSGGHGFKVGGFRRR